MDWQCIHTPIGTIDVCSELNDYSYGEKPGIKIGKVTTIISCLSKVVISNVQNGEKEVYEPVAIQSCMNPDAKQVAPIKVNFFRLHDNSELILEVTCPYKKRSINLDDKNFFVYTESYTPCIRVADCSDCTNCGRC